MMETRTGDMLAVTQGILVHGCNCQGVMGSGIARAVRDKWPDVYQAYRTRHQQSGLQLGDTIVVGSSPQAESPVVARHLHATTDQLAPQLIVVNAMTQHDYGTDQSRVYVDYAAVFAAFSRISLLARDTGLGVHFPLIGCGLANGQWSEVARMIGSAVTPSTQLVLWKLPA